MFNTELTRAINGFTQLMFPVSEKDLEREWVWKDHDEEGIRFAFFVTLQELRELAVTLSALRTKWTAAQHILGQYHAAYMDLQAALLGLPVEASDRAPAEGEWSVRRTYAHILGADINFTITVRYALEKHRGGTWTPEKISEEDDVRLAGISEADFRALMSSPLETMREYHRRFHPAIVEEFGKISNQELDFLSTFWEDTRFPIRHRLHRYEAHLVQHTVQIDKILAAIELAPSESKRLLRQIHAALAEAEGWMIGVETIDDAAILATASSISERTREISNLLV